METVVQVPEHQSEFAVSYEGPAFSGHTMEVRDLAPALLALGQAFDRANSLLNGDKANISLSIRATRPGSFEISLLLRQVLQGDFFTSAANLVEVVVGVPLGGMSLFGLLKRLRGRKPSSTETSHDGVLFEAEKVRFFVPTEVARLYSDKPLRDQLEAFVRPLFKEGVNGVVFRRDQENLESVRQAEAPYFGVEDEGSNVVEYIIPRQRLQITSLVFTKDGKWRLSDGANVHWYAMQDEDFILAIQHGKRFGKDDILVCQVLMTQRIGEDGKLKLEYAVQQVLQHIVPGEQMPFP